MSSIPEVPEASDATPAIGEYGQGDVAASVVSMSRRHAEGHDAEYLEWHMLDHLPEQYRLPGLRLGQRWVSTPACRQARLVSEAPYADVDHVVQHLFAEPVDVGLDRLVDVPGVAGAWCWAGATPRHERLDATEGLGLTVCYLDAPAVEVAPALEPVLARRWAEGTLVPLLAAPLELVTPGQWDRHRP